MAAPSRVLSPIQPLGDVYPDDCMHRKPFSPTHAGETGKAFLSWGRGGLVWQGVVQMSCVCKAAGPSRRRRDCGRAAALGRDMERGCLPPIHVWSIGRQAGYPNCSVQRRGCKSTLRLPFGRRSKASHAGKGRSVSSLQAAVHIKTHPLLL